MNKRSVKIAGHATSITLEDEFWEQLKIIAEQRGMSINTLVEEIDESRAERNLSAAIRVYILNTLLQ